MHKQFLFLFFLMCAWCASTTAALSDEGKNTTCGKLGDCLLNATNCEETCNCHKIVPHYYDNTTQRCEVDMLFLIQTLTEKYDTEVAVPSDEGKNTTCSKLGDCLLNASNCEETCDCDQIVPYYYDNTTQRCEIDMHLLILSLTEKYDTEAKIRSEADKIFLGVIVAALLFISCASICVIMACVYCFKINYSDYILKKSIEELAKKLGANPRLRSRSVKSPSKPISESCNVIVEEAGVFCV